MKWRVVVVAAELALLALILVRREAPVLSAVPGGNGAVKAEREVVGGRPVAATPADSRLATPPAAGDKWARVRRIQVDYEELHRSVSDELATADPAQPGRAAVFLKQLTLLERERRADLAAVLDTAELEDFEMKESLVGKAVSERLGGTAATEVQRREVFRARWVFDGRFAFAFDLAPERLAERERERKKMEERIRAALGAELYARPRVLRAS